MASPLCRYLDPNEDASVVAQGDVFDTNLIINNVSQSKQIINSEIPFLLSQIMTPDSHFTFQSSYPFPEFIQWCIESYSKSKRVIVNSKGSRILCKIDSQTIRQALSLSKSHKFGPFNEEECLRVYKEVNNEEKVQFVSKFLKPNQSIHQTPLPYHVKIFQDPIQSIFSLLCQILGYDDDRLVDEVMLGFLLKSNQPQLQ